MKTTQIKRLNRLIRFKAIDMEDFFTVSIWDDYISLLGRNSEAKFRRYNRGKAKIEIDANGYITIYRGCVRITLTS